MFVNFYVVANISFSFILLIPLRIRLRLCPDNRISLFPSQHARALSSKHKTLGTDANDRIKVRSCHVQQQRKKVCQTISVECGTTVISLIITRFLISPLLFLSDDAQTTSRICHFR